VAWSSKRGLDRLPTLSDDDKSAVLSAALPQFALDRIGDRLAAQSAVSIDHARNFVAKPGRDGFGGGLPHIFDRPTVLRLATEACNAQGDQRGWIIQACARPLPRPSLLVLPDASTPDTVNVAWRPSVPELGIFAVCLAGPDLPPSHQGSAAVGHLVRSKHADTQDGGLCKGYAVLDSPLLLSA